MSLGDCGTPSPKPPLVSLRDCIGSSLRNSHLSLIDTRDPGSQLVWWKPFAIELRHEVLILSVFWGYFGLTGSYKGP